MLEYNVRFGDPEAQVVLPRLAGDPVDLLMAVAEGRLATCRDRARASPTTPRSAWCWPPRATRPPRGRATPSTGWPTGQLAEPVDGVTVFHAGTGRRRTGGPFVTAGGRVLGRHRPRPRPWPRPAGAPTRRPASIGWDGVHYRTDIAERAATVRRPASDGGRP